MWSKYGILFPKLFIRYVQIQLTSFVGEPVGDTLGDTDGERDGFFEGEWLGLDEGERLGEREGFQPIVGCEIRYKRGGHAI